VVIVLRQRKGRTLPFVVKQEAEGVKIIRERVTLGAELHADEGTHGDNVEAAYTTFRINHGLAYSLHGGCTNQAESYFDPTLGRWTLMIGFRASRRSVRWRRGADISRMSSSGRQSSVRGRAG